jgi:hypothetical protein
MSTLVSNKSSIIYILIKSAYNISLEECLTDTKQTLILSKSLTLAAYNIGLEECLTDTKQTLILSKSLTLALCLLFIRVSFYIGNHSL